MLRGEGEKIVLKCYVLNMRNKIFFNLLNVLKIISVYSILLKNCIISK